jgi:hypothetical protein
MFPDLLSRDRDRKSTFFLAQTEYFGWFGSFMEGAVSSWFDGLNFFLKTVMVNIRARSVTAAPADPWVEIVPITDETPFCYKAITVTPCL